MFQMGNEPTERAPTGQSRDSLSKKLELNNNPENKISAQEFTHKQRNGCLSDADETHVHAEAAHMFYGAS